jgi:multiple sugar transport system permease protein
MSKPHEHSSHSMSAWWFVGPGLVLLSAFVIAPFLMALTMSFTDQRLIPAPEIGTAFVGLRNYERLLADANFWAALRNNAYFVAVVVPLQTALALLLAVLVNQKLRGSTFFRSVYFMPVATSMAVVAVIWSLMYAPQGGAINQVLGHLSFGSFSPKDWLRDPVWVMPAVMLLSIWQGVGFQMLVLLAGLQSIPQDLYEAAQMDGASPWQQFAWVNVPMLRNTLIFVVITTTIYAFQLYTQVQIIASSGASAPINSFRTLVMLIVQEGFKNGRIGYASAMACVFFFIVLALALLQRVLVRNEEARA